MPPDHWPVGAPNMRVINRSLIGGGSFSPTDLANLSGWWKADAGVFSDAGSTPAVADDPVQQWNDQSGNGKHLTQATSGDRPLFKTGIQNSLPALQFVSNDWLALGSALLTAAPITVYAVARSDSATAFQVVVGFFNSASSSSWFSLNMDGSVSGDPVSWWSRSGGIADALTTTGYTSGQAHVITGQESAADARLARIDEGSEGTDIVSTTPAGINEFAVGMARDSSPSAALNGYVMEVVVYAAAHDASTIAQVESYLAARWGL